MIRLAGIVGAIKQLNEEQPIDPAATDMAPRVPQKPAEDQLDVDYYLGQVDTFIETAEELDKELSLRLEDLSREYDEFRGNVYVKLDGSASRYLQAVVTNLEGLSEALQKLEQ